MFRDLMPDGLFVYLRHERKSPSNTNGINEEDPDAFSGGAGWEAKASTSIRLIRTSKINGPDEARLVFNKTRLTSLGFKELQLDVDDHGFFVPVHGHQTMLRYYPWCLPLEEQEQILRNGLASKTAVYQDIAQRTGVLVDTVKKAAQRGVQRGTQYPWIELVGKSAADAK